MVKDHSYSERGNPHPILHGLLFPISSKGYFIFTIPTDRKAYTTAFVAPVVKWLEQEIAQWVHHEESVWCPITPLLGALPWSYITLINEKTFQTDYINGMFSTNGPHCDFLDK